MSNYEAVEILVPMGDRVVVVDDGAGRLWRFTFGEELGLGAVEYTALEKTEPPPEGAVQAAHKCLGE